LQLLSERSGTAEHVEKEGDMIAVCDLAYDVRDVIVEYQVSTNTAKPTQGGSLTMHFIGRAAESNLQAEL